LPAHPRGRYIGESEHYLFLLVLNRGSKPYPEGDSKARIQNRGGITFTEEEKLIKLLLFQGQIYSFILLREGRNKRFPSLSLVAVNTLAVLKRGDNYEIPSPSNIISS